MAMEGVVHGRPEVWCNGAPPEEGPSRLRLAPRCRSADGPKSRCSRSRDDGGRTASGPRAPRSLRNSEPHVQLRPLRAHASTQFRPAQLRAHDTQPPAGRHPICNCPKTPSSSARRPGARGRQELYVFGRSMLVAVSPMTPTSGLAFSAATDSGGRAPISPSSARARNMNFSACVRAKHMEHLPNPSTERPW